MAYTDTLNSQQKKNIQFIIEEAQKSGITNPNSIAGMLAIISKESSFIPKEEKSYAGTDNSRIRKIFGSRVSSLSENELTALKSNPVNFFNRVYGGRYGNAANEGYKYRGRGFNQITFKGSYEKRGNQIGVDLVNNPDKLNEPKIAAKVAIQFFKDRIATLKRLDKLKYYNAADINDFKNTKDATMAFYHANTGAGKAVSAIKSKALGSATGGMKKALERVDSLLSKIGVSKKKGFKMIALTALLVVASYSILKYSGLTTK